MKVLVQRSLAAKVEVDGEIVGAIDHGQMVLVGIEKGDTEADTQRLADKLLKYRMFRRKDPSDLRSMRCSRMRPAYVGSP